MRTRFQPTSQKGRGRRGLALLMVTLLGTMGLSTAAGNSPTTDEGRLSVIVADDFDIMDFAGDLANMTRNDGVRNPSRAGDPINPSALAVAREALTQRQDLVGKLLPAEATALITGQQAQLDLVDQITASLTGGNVDVLAAANHAIAAHQGAHADLEMLLDVQTANVLLAGAIKDAATSGDSAATGLAKAVRIANAVAQKDLTERLDKQVTTVERDLAPTLLTTAIANYVAAQGEVIEFTEDQITAWEGIWPTVKSPLIEILEIMTLLKSTWESMPIDVERTEWPDAISTVLKLREDLLNQVVALERGVNEYPLGQELPECPGRKNKAVRPIIIPQVLILSMNCGDDTYPEWPERHVALSIDIGGQDTYKNNAGGSSYVYYNDCGHELPNDDWGMAATAIDISLPGDSGDDQYIGAQTGRPGNNGEIAAGPGCGMNGGAAFAGYGLLVDDRGNDYYGAGQKGHNGGAKSLSVGALLDGGGNDCYLAQDPDATDVYVGKDGTNGGAAGSKPLGGNMFGNLEAMGLLVDAEAFHENGPTGRNAGCDTPERSAFNDVYWGGSIGANGGGSDMSIGRLIDVYGNDDYRAGSERDVCVNEDARVGDADCGGLVMTSVADGVNGGGYDAGHGFLVDLTGDDVYFTGRYGGNGGARDRATGFLWDDMGCDDHFGNEGFGTNGGASKAAVGLLIDGAETTGAARARATFAGCDHFEGGKYGTNGGAQNIAAGILINAGSTSDLYDVDPRVADAQQRKGVHGGGYERGYGMLADAGGDDVYRGAMAGANGGAGFHSRGFLLDLGGCDDYLAGDNATFGDGRNGFNGGAYQSSVGLLADMARSGEPGNCPDGEHYAATGYGVNGGAAGVAVGMLLDDGASRNVYSAPGLGVAQGHIEGAPLGMVHADRSSNGANGGAYLAGGVGFLIDTGGDDRYEAGDRGVNGGGYDESRVGARGWKGTAAVMVYQEPGVIAETYACSAWSRADSNAVPDEVDACNTFSAILNTDGNAGFLFDGGGSDSYDAGGRGANGGAARWAHGLLIDAGFQAHSGPDSFTGTHFGVNGGGANHATGALWDAAGDADYVAEGYGVNGGAAQAGVGLLVDLSGEDTYTATGVARGEKEDMLRPDQNGTYGANGGTYGFSVGVLLDGGGQDTYRVDHGWGGNGASSPEDYQTCLDAGRDHCFISSTYGGVALLSDSGGASSPPTVGDRYAHSHLPAEEDQTIIPKGRCGAQSDDTSPATATAGQRATTYCVTGMIEALDRLIAGADTSLGAFQPPTPPPTTLIGPIQPPADYVL